MTKRRHDPLRRRVDRWAEADVSPWSDWALGATYAAVVSFAVAVFAPCFTIKPKFGGELVEEVARWMDPKSLEPRTYSLLGGIGHLLHGGDLLLGSILLMFCVVFPSGKLGATFYLLHAEPATIKKHVGWLGHLGKWSMLDVFVVAGLVVSFKSFPLGTRIEPRWGIGLFAISVLLGLFATQSLKR